MVWHGVWHGTFGRLGGFFDGCPAYSRLGRWAAILPESLSLIGHIDIKSGRYIIRISGFTISLFAQIRAADMYNSIDTFIIQIALHYFLHGTHDRCDMI